MKRYLTILLAFVLVITALPACAATAPDANTAPDAMILKVKKLFAIEDNYEEFTVNVEQNGGQTYYFLHWYDPNEILPNIDVSMTENRILSYHAYRYTDDHNEEKTLSSAELKEKAQGYMEHILPDLAKEFSGSLPGDLPHTFYGQNEVGFQFYREKNGILVIPQYVDISVDQRTGELISYNLIMNRFGTAGETAFPDTKGMLDKMPAKTAYEKEIRIVPAYMRIITDNGKNIQYKPIYTNLNYAFDIDAKTGKPILLIADKFYGGYGAGEDKAASPSEVEALSPEEQAVADQINGLKTQAEAETALKNTGFIPDKAKLSRVYVNKRYDNPQLYQYSFNYKLNDSYFFASIDAQKLDILSLYRDFSSYGQKISAEDAKKAAQEALVKYAPEVKDQVELLLYPDQNADSYTFTFVRKLHDRYVIDDTITIIIHGKTGQVSSINKSWYEGDIAPAAQELGTKAATDIFWKSAPFYPAYKSLNPNENAPLKTTLVYTMGSQIPIYLDAYTGIRLNDQGQPDTKHLSAESYSDWDDVVHKKEILELLIMGIGYAPGKFSPQGNLTQKEFYQLLLANRGLSAPELNEQALIRAGVVKKGEYRPQEPIKKITAIKGIIRADYSEDVASIPGIYRALTEDTKNLGADLGYMTLAAGKGYVPIANGKLEPQKILTREDGAMLIYYFTHPLPFQP